jgi:predicted Zn-dependent protease
LITPLFLAGTIPINIDIKSSDLDIICCFDSKNEFEDYVQLRFGNFSEFTIKHITVNGQETVVANFVADGWEIEILDSRYRLSNRLRTGTC